MNAERSPLVSVAFPIHKTNKYFLKALESLTNQIYNPIEILLVDSSTKGIPLPSLLDNRIRIIRVPDTFGLSDSLNTAIEMARGKYLARMDYDDISLPNRIRNQVDFLESHLDISIVGTSAYIITSDDDSINKNRILKRPITHNEILNEMLFKNALLHPTVMLRLDDFRLRNLLYSRKFDSAEDFDLWVRASHELKFANLPDPLVAIRHHESQYSKIDRSRSEILSSYIKFRHLVWMIVHKKIEIRTAVLALHTILRHLLQLLKSYNLYTAIDKFDK